MRVNVVWCVLNSVYGWLTTEPIVAPTLVLAHSLDLEATACRTTEVRKSATNSSHYLLLHVLQVVFSAYVALRKVVLHPQGLVTYLHWETVLQI